MSADNSGGWRRKAVSGVRVDCAAPPSPLNFLCFWGRAIRTRTPDLQSVPRSLIRRKKAFLGKFRLPVLRSVDERRQFGRLAAQSRLRGSSRLRGATQSVEFSLLLGESDQDSNPRPPIRSAFPDTAQEGVFRQVSSPRPSIGG